MASARITISDSSDESSHALNTRLRSTARKRKFSSHITSSDESNCCKRKCCCSTSSTSSTDESNCAEWKCCCSTSSTDNDLPESWSTCSDSSVTNSNATQCDNPTSNVAMECLMISKIFEIMPTTSSPISKRRGIPFTNYVGYTPPSDTYCQWRKNLNKTPISNRYLPGLPEAEAGQFSPLSYCAYTYLHSGF